MVASSAHLGGQLWHPFSSMPAAGRDELTITRGRGILVWDSDGTEYIDATAGLWYCNIGHGRTELAEAARHQMSTLAAYQTFGSLSNAPASMLAERLGTISPLPDPSAVFFVSGGSDAIDTAAKIARRYWQLQGKLTRTLVVSRDGAYHGMHAYGTSIAGIWANASGWGTMIPDTRVVPMHDLTALGDLFDREGDRIAAFIAEPVIGAGGVHPPPDGYWKGVQELCNAYGVLLVVDEVVTGYGRLGAWFASDHYDIKPDIVTSAKGITSGYLPLGAVVAGPRILDVVWGVDAPIFRHGYTYSGHPTACAVGLANLDIIAREDMLAHARALIPTFADAVGSLRDHPLVHEIRCAGLLAAIELDGAALSARSLSLDDVVSVARTCGVLTRGLVGRSLQLSPALVISAAEVRLLVARLREALDLAAQEDHSAVEVRRA